MEETDDVVETVDGAGDGLRCPWVVVVSVIVDPVVVVVDDAVVVAVDPAVVGDPAVNSIVSPFSNGCCSEIVVVVADAAVADRMAFASEADAPAATVEPPEKTEKNECRVQALRSRTVDVDRRRAGRGGVKTLPNVVNITE